MKSNGDNFISRGCFINQDTKNPISKHIYNKLKVNDWLKDIELPKNQKTFNFVEVRFKHNRKKIYKNINDIKLRVGDTVAVEISPGHDIGIVSMMGELVRIKMKKLNINPASEEIKKIYRKTRPSDIEKWSSVINLEEPTMFKARKITEDLNLKMKIDDVEYQADKTKAIFYYTSDERIDFRELVRVLSETFMVRVEMRQIGARQETNQLGGIGSCGRELCCSTWLTDFKSVSINTARCQQLSLNPQKLTGQCGKLKCCMNYEYKCYLDTMKDFPKADTILKTKKGEASIKKTDILKRKMWLAYTDDTSNLIPIYIDKIKNIIELNSKGIKPDDLEAFAEKEEPEITFEIL
jgi:cell fate regulator YaaT (PSP1 superfamily)